MSPCACEWLNPKDGRVHQQTGFRSLKADVAQLVSDSSSSHTK